MVPSIDSSSKQMLKSCSWTFTTFVLSCQDDVDQATSIEELEKQIEKIAKVWCF